MTVINGTQASTGNVVGIQVDANGFLRNRLTDGTNDVTVTGNRLDVNATVTNASTIGTTIWQQYVALGKCFFACTNFITISGSTETNFLLLRNPAGSGKTIRINEIDIGVVATVTGDNARVKFYRDATVTANGTAITPVKMVKNQANNAVLLTNSGPTTSALGTLMATIVLTQAWQAAYKPEMSFYIQEGENMLITIQPGNTGKAHTVTVWFGEE